MSSSPPPPLLEVLGGNATAYASSHFKDFSSSFFILLLLLVIFFASLSLCLLLRYLKRRCLLCFSAGTSSSSISRRISPAEVAPAEASSPVDSVLRFPSSSVTRCPSTSAADCAVCLSKFETYDQLRLLPLCCHAFHAHCINTWLQSNQMCPLCRSSIFISESDILKASIDSSAAAGLPGDSFRLEIGSISRRNAVMDSGDGLEDESEVRFDPWHRTSNYEKEDVAAPAPPVPAGENLSGEVASGRRTLKDYMDRLSNSVSSRALSFRSSGRFFTDSSRQNEVGNAGEWDQEAHRAGEEISELFRWFSGV